MKFLKYFVLFFLLLSFFSCKDKEVKATVKAEKEHGNYKVTFIEIGSVNCVPCKMMQPIMKEIEKEYQDVKVVFYDVWKSDGKKKAKPYKIKLIPTQIFLDKSGNEYFRHEGFFPKKELKNILEKGLKL